MSEAERQKWYYDRKTIALSLEPGKLVLAKADAYSRKRKVKDQWEEELYEVEGQVAEGIPSYCKQPMDRMHMSPPPKLTFLFAPTEGTLLCMVM